MLKKLAKKFPPVLCLIMLFALISACSPVSNNKSVHKNNANLKGEVECLVVGISDGDTIRCLTADKQELKVRLNQIDAPEKKQAFGNRSKQTLSGLIYKKNVILDISGKDRYQRYLAIIYYQQQNINLKMVQLGMAWAYVQYMKDPIYLEAQKQAQQQGIGLWRDKDPIEPQQFRKQQKAQKENN